MFPNIIHIIVLVKVLKCKVSNADVKNSCITQNGISVSRPDLV